METLPIPEEQQLPIENHKRKNFNRFVIVGIIIFFLIAVYVFFSLRTSHSIVTPDDVIEKTLLPSPTPFQFREMTIPYLREKQYKSSLGELEHSYDTENYKAYLTSYTSDGLKINALLTKPTEDMPVGGWPAIIFIHGYIPPSQYQTTQNYYDYVDYLARTGFVIFKIDLRGHGNSEGEPSGAYYSSDYISDALHAYVALESSSFVNPKRIGLWGHSMAGNIVLRSFAAKPEIPAVVIWAGAGYSYTDLIKYRINDASYQPPASDSTRVRRREQLTKLYGQPSTDSPFWQQVAPTTYLSDLKGALQLHHAVDDDVVNIGYSQDLNALLEPLYVPHEFYEYPNGGHNISGRSFISAMDRTVTFFRKYLQ